MRVCYSLFFFALFPFNSCSAQTEKKAYNQNNYIDQKEMSDSILLVFHASDGSKWLGSDNQGVYWVKNQTILHFTTSNGLANNRIREIKEDKKGNIFVATLQGICLFDGTKFSLLKAIKRNDQQSGWRLHPDDLWFCTPGMTNNKGPYRFDGENLLELEFPKHDMEDDYYARFPNAPWSPYEVYSIFQDRQGNVWFGTANFGVCRYDGKTFNWLYEDHLTNIPNGGMFGIRSIREDSRGDFWICNTQHRFQISSKTKQNSEFSWIDYSKKKGITDIKTPNGLDYVYFMSIAEDKQGRLWMATFNEGIYCYDGTKTQHYSLSNGSKTVTVFSISIDQNDQIWIGTHNDGVYHLNGSEFQKHTF